MYEAELSRISVSINLIRSVFGFSDLKKFHNHTKVTL